MKQIREPSIFSGEEPSEAARMLWMARASDRALRDAADALAEAQRFYVTENPAAAALHVGIAAQAIRDGLYRSGDLQRQLHEQFGEEVTE